MPERDLAPIELTQPASLYMLLSTCDRNEQWLRDFTTTDSWPDERVGLTAEQEQTHIRITLH